MNINDLLPDYNAEIVQEKKNYCFAITYPIIVAAFNACFTTMSVYHWLDNDKHHDYFMDGVLGIFNFMFVGLLVDAVYSSYTHFQEHPPEFNLVNFISNNINFYTSNNITPLAGEEGSLV
jgi:hypothetical protein